VFFAAEDGKVIFAITRGDMEVNETKLRQASGARALRPATEEEIRAVGAEPGYGSAVGVRGALVVVDDLVAASPNLVSGANEEGYHLLNVNSGRDYTPDIVADITAARGGEPCLACGSPLQAERGVEVGNIFKLGTRYSVALGALYDDPHGQLRHRLDRLMATAVELHHDKDGIVWPDSIAPYRVHLVHVGKEGDGTKARGRGALRRADGRRRRSALRRPRRVGRGRQVQGRRPHLASPGASPWSDRGR
jgi:prolyl-tRNA synthetase